MGVIENFPYGRTPPILRSSAESLASSNFNSSIPPTPPSELEDTVSLQCSNRSTTQHSRRRDPALLIQRLEQISRKKVGSQKARRENNALILQTLAEDEEDSPYKCPSIEDFKPSSESAFSKLMKDTESMKVWQHFIAQSEAEQLKYLTDISQKSKSKEMNFDLGIYFTQAHVNKVLGKVSDKEISTSPDISPSERFGLITRNFKNVLKKPSLPMGTIGHLEGDVVGIFQEDCNAVYVSPELNNFERLLLHGISQYYLLHSKSMNLGGGRRTKVENKYTNFSPPKVSLKSYLQKRQS